MARNKPMTLEEFIKETGYFPSTVTEHRSHGGGMVLETIDPDPDTNIVTFDGDKSAMRQSQLDGAI